MPHLVAELRGGRKTVTRCTVAAVDLKQERVPVLVHEFGGQKTPKDLDVTSVKDGECREYGKGLVRECNAGQTMRHVAFRSDVGELFLDLPFPSRGENLDIVTEQDKVDHTIDIHGIL